VFCQSHASLLFGGTSPFSDEKEQVDVVNLDPLHLLDDARQIAAVGQVAKRKEKRFWLFLIRC
jgi:hypothetical protein